MSRESGLFQYIPRDVLGNAIELQTDLTDVVDRLSRILPPDKLWEFFSSAPRETGGNIVFPCCRVDSSLLVVRDRIRLLQYPDIKAEERIEHYDFAARYAFKAVTWVEIGFEGLENLAHSRASKSWTAGIGLLLTDEARAEKIMTQGVLLYRDCIKTFADYRLQKGISNDYFRKYGVEPLLSNFQ